MANIELPKDAEGREIPLNTETLYTDRGPIFRVEKFEYVRSMGWCIYGRYEGETVYFAAIPSSLYLIQPDSWEKLLADLKRGASRVHHPECAYFGRDENDCDQCEAVCSFACKKIAFGDIESRIRKLMGEDQ